MKKDITNYLVEIKKGEGEKERERGREGVIEEEMKLKVSDKKDHYVQSHQLLLWETPRPLS